MSFGYSEKRIFMKNTQLYADAFYFLVKFSRVQVKYYIIQYNIHIICNYIIYIGLGPQKSLYKIEAKVGRRNPNFGWSDFRSSDGRPFFAPHPLLCVFTRRSSEIRKKK